MLKSIGEDASEEVPSAFPKLMENLERWVDRRLGYKGDRRFVYFYYEPETQSVVWNDGESYGFAAKAWGIFKELISPLGRRYRVNLGRDESAKTHVLLIDRLRQSSYFVEEWEAERFLAGQSRREAA